MIYDNDLKVSSKYANSTKRFIDSIISNYNESNVPEKSIDKRLNEDAKMVLENTVRRDNALNRYHSFAQTIRNVLVTEALYSVYKDSVSDDLKDDPTNVTVMRSIVNQYVQDNGYDKVLDNMKTASVAMSEMYNVITKCSKSILESVDKTNPDTFVITPDMKDEFFNQLNYSDNEEISKAINNRVSDAMQDFITANTKDHEDIEQALNQAQENIEKSPEEDVELKEFYEMKGRRKVSEIRNAPKGLLHGMVSAMCESVIKHKELHNEFMTEGHLNMDKIVSRVSLMYTFLETLNTTNIETIDECYIESLIKDLKK